MDPAEIEEDNSGPSSLSSDQASLCVIPDPDESSEEDGFIYLDKNSLPSGLSATEGGRAVIVFHSVDEEYSANQGILCQYIRPPGWKEIANDGIGLFKVGWVTVGESIAFISIKEPLNDTNPIGYVMFSAELLPKDEKSLYQFCFMRDSLLLGASTPFQFKCSGVGENSAEIKGEVKHSVEEKLAEQLRRRELDLSRLQEEFTKLVCMKDEQKKVHLSTLESVERQLGFQSTCLTQLASAKASLEAEKAALSQKVVKLTAICENLPVIHQHLSGLDGVTKPTMEKVDEEKQKELSKRFSCLAETGCSMDQSWKTSSQTTSFESLYASGRTVSSSSDESSSTSSKEVEGGNATAEICRLKQRLDEVTEEKKWFQEQYGTVSVSLKQCTDQLAAEHTQHSSLSGQLAELMISHKMVCTENARLNEELSTVKEKLKEIDESSILPDMENISQLQEYRSENEYLREELEYLRNQIKMLKTGTETQNCTCEDKKEKIKMLQLQIMGADLIKATLEAELEQELKLGEDRDRRLAQLEQSMLEDLRMKSERAVGAAFGTASEATLHEMEQNTNCALEALDCALKEIQTLRSRKAAVSRANRALREAWIKEKDEYEKKFIHLNKACGDAVNSIRAELERKENVDKENNELKKANVQLQQHISQLEHLDTPGDNSEMEANTRCALEALEAAQKEVLSLREQRSALQRECCIRQQQLQEEKEKQRYELQQQETEERNTQLTSKLRTASEEYRKLYLEKARIQEKFDRLQLKVRAKVGVQVRQTSSGNNSGSATTSNGQTSDSGVSARHGANKWTGFVDELM